MLRTGAFKGAGLGKDVLLQALRGRWHLSVGAVVAVALGVGLLRPIGAAVHLILLLEATVLGQAGVRRRRR